MMNTLQNIERERRKKATKKATDIIKEKDEEKEEINNKRIPMFNLEIP
jgi:hypothetical protein